MENRFRVMMYKLGTTMFSYVIVRKLFFENFAPKLAFGCNFCRLAKNKTFVINFDSCGDGGPCLYLICNILFLLGICPSEYPGASSKLHL